MKRPLSDTCRSCSARCSRRGALLFVVSILVLVGANPSLARQRTTPADLVGTWRGERVALDGSAERVVLHLELDEAGALVGLLEWPDRDDPTMSRLDPMSIQLELLDGRLTDAEDFFEAFIEDQRTTLRGFWYYHGRDDRPMNLDRVGADGELVAKPPPRRRPRPVVETDPAPRPAGRWHGHIERPDEEPIELFLDLDRVTTVDGPTITIEWVGELDLAYQTVTSYPVGDLSVDGEGAGASVRFVARGLRDDPVFAGRLDTEKTVIDGTFDVGSMRLPVRLERIGDAELEPRPKLAPLPERVGEQWAGRWQGTLRFFGLPKQRVVLNLDMVDRNALVGTLDLPDRGSVGMPIVEIMAWTTSLRVKLPHSKVEIDGYLLSEDGKTLTAIWSLDGNSQRFELRKVDGAEEPASDR
ncbi:MAG: hypothetical protein AAGE94_18180 [Acidobacteriota bacterium]